MQLSLFVQTTGEIRRPLLLWTIILVGAAWLLALAHPLLLFLNGGAFSASHLPAWLQFLFDSPVELSSPAGWLRSVIFGLVLPLLLPAFAAWYGSWLVAGEEERGSLGLLLAGSMLRYRVIVQKFFVLLLLVFVPSAAVWLGLNLLFWLSSAGEFAFISRASASLFLFSLAFGSLALALGSVTGKLRRSRWILLAVGVVTLLLYRLPVNIAGLPVFQFLSPFYYYERALFAPLFFPYALVLVLLAAACLTLAWAAFERRDLPV